MDAKPVAPEESKKEEVEVKATDVKTTPAATAEAPKPAAETEDVPDPDEDDLDDLDGEKSCTYTENLRDSQVLITLLQTCWMTFRL